MTAQFKALYTSEVSRIESDGYRTTCSLWSVLRAKFDNSSATQFIAGISGLPRRHFCLFKSTASPFAGLPTAGTGFVSFANMGSRPMNTSVFNLRLLFCFLFFGFCFAWGHDGSHHSDKVLLSDVDTLTLYGDRSTAYRRTVLLHFFTSKTNPIQRPFPQLKCVGGDAEKYGYRVDVMQCKNMGGSYGSEDIQWSCTAELPSEFKLGRTEVVCEGYSSPDDPYILKGLSIALLRALMVGSCGVEYTLYLTPKGRDMYARPPTRPVRSEHRVHVDVGKWWTESSSSFFLFRLFRGIKSIITSFFNFILDNPLLILLAMYISYRILRYILYITFKWLRPRARAARAPRPPRNPWWSGFFGGGGGGGDDPPGPPPPYARYPPYSSRKTYQVPPEAQPWRPGFWTGFGTGAATGYGLGSRNRAQNTQPRYETRTNVQDPPAPRSSGWFGGGDSGSSTTSYSSSNLGRRNSDDSRDDSQTTHTSTGFGGTRRR